MSSYTTPLVEPLWFIDGLVRIHVSGEENERQFSVLENTVPRGDMPPLHVHHEEDEIFHILDGEITVFLPRQEMPLTTGQTLLAPRGVPHTFRVESEVARLLVYCVPARFDGFVRAVSEPAPIDELPPCGRPIDPEAFAATAAEYGIEILGPPGTLPEA